MTCPRCHKPIQEKDRVCENFRDRVFVKRAQDTEPSWKDVTSSYWGTFRGVSEKTISVQHGRCPR